jgi:sugar lactone lactonase YvrE
VAESRFRGARWHPPAPFAPPPRRTDRPTLPALSLLRLPGKGPEHIAVDRRGRLLTGLADGRIVRVDPAAHGAWDVVADTGGRPLGMELRPGDGPEVLVVCDERRGLLEVDLPQDPVGRDAPAAEADAAPAGPRSAPRPSRNVRVLCDTVAGRRLIFSSCPAIARDGSVYFTQSSQRYDLEHYKGDLLEHSGTGRVLRYRDGAVQVLADGLQFANGAVLAADESWLDVAETGAYRITRFALETGPGPGRGRVIERRTLIGALPGFPDNLTAGPDGLLWVAMASPRDSALDLLLPHAPWLRALIWSAPPRLQPGPKNLAWALAVDRDGTVVRDLRAWHVGYREVTAARQVGSRLYLASIDEAALAWVDLAASAQRRSG